MLGFCGQLLQSLGNVSTCTSESRVVCGLCDLAVLVMLFCTAAVASDGLSGSHGFV